MKNYQYISDNSLDLCSFIEDYKKGEKSEWKEKRRFSNAKTVHSRGSPLGPGSPARLVTKRIGLPAASKLRSHVNIRFPWTCKSTTRASLTGFFRGSFKRFPSAVVQVFPSRWSGRSRHSCAGRCRCRGCQLKNVAIFFLLPAGLIMAFKFGQGPGLWTRRGHRAGLPVESRSGRLCRETDIWQKAAGTLCPGHTKFADR